MIPVGAKNVSKEMKITQGRVKDRDVTWFHELVDKRKLLLCLCVLIPSIFFSLLGRSVKTHLYWSMLNCKCDPQKLSRLIENIPNHYQVWLLKLYCSSPVR